MEVKIMLEYMEELEYPLDRPSAEVKLSREIMSYVLESYLGQMNQSVKMSELTVPVDDLIQDRFFNQNTVDEDIFDFKKNEILKVIDSIIVDNTRLTQYLTNLKSSIEAL